MSESPANPLRDLHRQAEAEFQNYADIEIVSTFGEPQAEYAAVRKSVGVMDLPQRGVIELSGRDRLRFLNGLITAETISKETKQPLAAGSCAYSFLLNLKGRVVVDMNVLELGEQTLLELDRRFVEPVHQVLEAYHFSEDVKMRCRGDLHEIALHGPGVQAAMPLLEQQTCTSTDLFGCPVIAWRDDPTGAAGVHLITEPEHARAIWMRLITTLGQQDETGKRRLRPIGWAAFNTTRIEAGCPLFGIDFDGAAPATALPTKQQREQAGSDESAPGILPAETGLMSRAVSLSKCYVGQEVVARMHARGQLARKIVGFRMTSGALPLAGAQVFDEASNVIGIVTSSTISPVLSNAAIGMALVKRPMFEIGTALRIPAEGELHAARVVEMPFVA